MSRCIPPAAPVALNYPLRTRATNCRAEVASALASTLGHVLWIAYLCWRAAGR